MLILECLDIAVDVHRKSLVLVSDSVYMVRILAPDLTPAFDNYEIKSIFSAFIVQSVLIGEKRDIPLAVNIILCHNGIVKIHRVLGIHYAVIVDVGKLAVAEIHISVRVKIRRFIGYPGRSKLASGFGGIPGGSDGLFSHYVLGGDALSGLKEYEFFQAHNVQGVYGAVSVDILVMPGEFFECLDIESVDQSVGTSVIGVSRWSADIAVYLHGLKYSRLLQLFARGLFDRIPDLSKLQIFDVVLVYIAPYGHVFILIKEPENAFHRGLLNLIDLSAKVYHVKFVRRDPCSGLSESNPPRQAANHDVVFDAATRGYFHYRVQADTPEFECAVYRYAYRRIQERIYRVFFVTVIRNVIYLSFQRDDLPGHQRTLDLFPRHIEMSGIIRQQIELEVPHIDHFLQCLGIHFGRHHDFVLKHGVPVPEKMRPFGAAYNDITLAVQSNGIISRFICNNACINCNGTYVFASRVLDRECLFRYACGIKSACIDYLYFPGSQVKIRVVKLIIKARDVYADKLIVAHIYAGGIFPYLHGKKLRRYLHCVLILENSYKLRCAGLPLVGHRIYAVYLEDLSRGYALVKSAARIPQVRLPFFVEQKMQGMFFRELYRINGFTEHTKRRQCLIFLAVDQDLMRPVVVEIPVILAAEV